MNSLNGTLNGLDNLFTYKKKAEHTEEGYERNGINEDNLFREDKSFDD